jgi:hypothetical protein
MKLTWFGGRALRAHIGGEIVVIDPDDAPKGIDRAELLGGADRVIRAMDDSACPAIESAAWRPRPASRAVDETAPLPVEVFRMGEAALLVDAVGEPPLVVVGGGEAPRFGRWAGDAVIVLVGASEPLIDLATVILDVASPRLIALAADEQTIDRALAELAEHLDGTGLVSLEPGLALEV